MFDLKSESGFTLLEIILGTAVLGILAVAVMGYWQNSTQTLETLQLHQMGTELAKNSIEKFKAEAVNLSSDDDFKNELTALATAETEIITSSGTDFTRQINIADYNSNPAQQKVEVRVAWGDSEIVLNTLITDKRKQVYALEFDGIDDYVDIDDSSSLDLAAPFTVEFWFRANSMPTSGSAVPVAKGTYTDQNEFAWWFELLSNGNLEFSINYQSGSIKTVEVNLNNNEWYHLAGVYTGSEQKLYLDGNLEERINTSGAVLNNEHPLLLAVSHDDSGSYSQYTAAQLKELRIWGTNRSNISGTNKISETMQQELSGGETGLIGYWKLDEGASTTAYDYTNGNNGVINGAEYRKVFWLE